MFGLEEGRVWLTGASVRVLEWGCLAWCVWLRGACGKVLDGVFGCLGGGTKGMSNIETQQREQKASSPRALHHIPPIPKLLLASGNSTTGKKSLAQNARNALRQRLVFKLGLSGARGATPAGVLRKRWRYLSQPFGAVMEAVERAESAGSSFCFFELAQL